MYTNFTVKKWDSVNKIFTLKEWQTVYKDPHNLIVQASSPTGDDSWQSFPIGMQYSYIYNQSAQIGNHSNLVLCAFNNQTDNRRRPIHNRKVIESNLSKNNIQNIKLNPATYFAELPKYKFVISPEGNGIDCHRHYEALIAGCIPIIENNLAIRHKYAGLPILYTHNYSEVTADYLNRQYQIMLNTRYDFSRLFLNFYSEDQQRLIKQYGNYWTKKMTNRIYY